MLHIIYVKKGDVFSQKLELGMCLFYLRHFEMKNKVFSNPILLLFADEVISSHSMKDVPNKIFGPNVSNANLQLIPYQ